MTNDELNTNNDEQRPDPYGPRETSDQDTVGPTLDYSPPAEATINPEEAWNNWEAQHGADAEQNRDSCVWLVENFTPELVEGLADERNLAYDVELGSDLLAIYNLEMSRMSEEDSLAGMYPSMAGQVNQQAHADIKQRIEVAVMNAKARYDAKSSNIHNRR